MALGSSFAAGPGVTEPADGPPACAQSKDNYPRQLARMRRLKLIDRSCSGATTVHILKGGQFGVLPPQIDGLTADTRLVTVTIGGNDVRYMADLGLAACRSLTGAADRCAPPASFDLERAFDGLAANLRAITVEVRRRSPQARLVFVDYVTVLPPDRPCAATPLTSVAAQSLRARAERLAALTAEVAREAGADIVKASELTHGHDACAAAPWVNGYVARGQAWGPVGFHPRLEAMTAVAKALDRQLPR